MATITGLTKARMLEIEAASVVNGFVNVDGDLILEKHDGSTVAAGSVIGPPGPPGTIDGTLGNADNRVPRSDGNSGNTIQPSSVEIDDSGVIAAQQVLVAAEPTTDSNVASKGYVDRGVVLPGCIVSRDTPFAIPNNTLTAVEFDDTDTRDTNDYHDSGANSDRMVIPSLLDGLYRVTATVKFNLNGSGRRYIGVYYVGSGTSLYDGQYVLANEGFAETVLTMSVELEMNAGDYVNVQVLQSSGASLYLLEARASLTRISKF